MEQYIKKSTLVAEIEKLLRKDKYSTEYVNGKKYALKKILSFLDTLEVKEADLEDTKKEELAQKYVDYTFKRHNIDANSKEGLLIYYAFVHGMNKCLTQLRA